MSTEIKVPELGESVTEATVGQWLKKAGDQVDRDEPLVELETDKVTLEVNAPHAGTLSSISAEEGAEVEVGAVLAMLEEGAGAAAQPAREQAEQPEQPAGEKAEQPAEAPAGKPAEKRTEKPAAETADSDTSKLSPAVRRLIDEHNLAPQQIPASGKDGRLTKGDVLAFIEGGSEKKAAPEAKAEAPAEPGETGPREERVRMTRLRRRVAERLKEAQNTAAMLTTFNEADMSELLAVREEYKESFEKKHGVKLGFMSFFVKAAVTALQDVPAVNGEIDGDDIIYKNYYDIGVAVSAPQGLVVPVVRDCDRLSFADVEKTIGALGKKARDGKLSLDDLTGGTFTISNGGVFGSLLSTPILNPPQSGILGMHKIQKRPLATGDESAIRPMMYLALSYDHRLIDGREAVTFLVRVKECIEDPRRLLLNL